VRQRRRLQRGARNGRCCPRNFAVAAAEKAATENETAREVATEDCVACCGDGARADDRRARHTTLRHLLTIEHDRTRVAMLARSEFV
jgi:hypothetical protein